MATHDYIISNASGAAVRADLNNALAAIATNNSSATEPTTTYAYQWWADTGSTPTVMKLRNAANSAWITLFQLDGEWSLIPFENGTAAAPSIYFKDSGTDTGFYSPGVDQVGITTGGAVRLTTSTTAFTGTLPWQGQNGTAAAPALSFSGDPNSGVYNVGADDVGISTNGTLRFDVSTTATTSTLPVVHPLGAVGTPSVTFAGDLNTGIWSPAADTIAASTNGSERLRITSTGLVGIGNTAPSALLDLGSATVTQGYIKLRSTGSGAREANIYSPATGGLTIDTNSYAYPVVIQADTVQFGTGVSGTERARIDSSGRLLVGTTAARTNFFTGVVAPQIQLEGNSSSTSALSVVRNSNDADGPTLLLGRSRGTGNTVVQSGDRIGRLEFQGNDGTNFISAGAIECFVDTTPGANDMPGRLVFSTTIDAASTLTERMRISNAGILFIIASNTDNLAIRNTAAAGTTIYFIRALYNATDNVTGGTESFRVSTNGNVQNTNNSYGAISDVKLKENIVDATSQWSDIKALQVRKYNFKEGQTHTQIGLVAQEVELVSPGLVTESPDCDEDGNDLGTVTKSVNYSVLYMKAVKALQEAMERIETLEAKVAALEAN